MYVRSVVAYMREMITSMNFKGHLVYVLIVLSGGLKRAGKESNPTLIKKERPQTLATKYQSKDHIGAYYPKGTKDRT